MPYQLHPSTRLVAQFKQKPWQGCDPRSARYLFIGLDANYAMDIEYLLPEVFDYLDNGVVFWQSHRVHHPFLLPSYTGSGKRYHLKFSDIGFTPDHADMVSFVEVLDLPTVGVNKLTPDDLSPVHLKFLADLLDQGSAEHVFLPSAVVSLLRKTGQFRWLPGQPKATGGALRVLRERSEQVIYQMYHLSCYGWQLSELDRQIAQIRTMVTSL